MDKKYLEYGSVSIFSVIFAALLLSLVTIGFTKLILEGQSRAAANELSQSAYDAALAGVEDAKRVIRACQKGNNPACAALKHHGDKCDVIHRSHVIPGSGTTETAIRSVHNAGQSYDQAYTCVKIHMNSGDYIYKAQQETAHAIPLASKSDFDTVKIDWFTSTDKNGIAASDTRGSIAGDSLPKQTAWPHKAPPLIRAQVITPRLSGGKFRIESLDDSNASGSVFVKPRDIMTHSEAPTTELTLMPRVGENGQQDGRLDVIVCDNFKGDGYACSVTIKISTTVSAADSRHALLHITPIYNDATVRVSLAKSGTPVMLRDMQPSVDATGRAANVFRRVQARLQLGNNFEYPNANVVQVKNALCKKFKVSSSGDSVDLSGGLCN